MKTAAERTISLFTGKTDAEAKNARDGSDPDPPLDPYRGLPRRKWTRLDCLSVWFTKYDPNRDVYAHRIVRKEDGKYELWRRKRFHGTYDSIVDAANASEELAD